MTSRRTCLAQGLAALALTGCTRGVSSGNQITVALSSRALVYGGLFIAHQAGFFARRGLNLKLIAMESGNAAITALISGSAQFSGSGPGEIIAARARGQDVAIVMNLYRGLSASVMLSKRLVEQRGLSPSMSLDDRFRALDGVSLAAPSPTSAFVQPLRVATMRVGAKPRFVYMAQTIMPVALSRHSVQAFTAGAPFSDIPVENGTGIAWISGPKGEYPIDALPTSSVCLQTTGRYARENPSVIAAMRDAMSDLPAYLRDQGAQARKDLALAYPLVTEGALERSFANDAPNWVRPSFSDADLAKEVAIYARSAASPLPASFDPGALVLNS